MPIWKANGSWSRNLRLQIRNGTGIICIIFNYSLPGGLKNAIDWGSRPYGQSVWQGKTAAIMGVSIGNFGTARAQYDLRKILVALDMPVVVQPEVMIGNAAERFDQNGVLTDDRSRQLIKKLLSTLVQLEKSARRARGDSALPA